MATFENKSFIKHDDYGTPKYAFQNIMKYIPKNKVIWDCFFMDGKSGLYLEELGFKVIHEPIDFFIHNKGDIVVSNPPFSKIPQILNRLVHQLNKPFILIMPSSKINTQYFRKCFQNVEKPQIIIPRRRIHFEKKINGIVPLNWGNRCYFDCFYYCWKIGLKDDITWLNNDECVEIKKK
tara:strand:+ start:740 stop:1276 length:537 start_codon:yes stop_codon:yes gene_type:complete